MLKHELQEIISNIKYKADFCITVKDNTIEVAMMTPCVHTGKYNRLSFKHHFDYSDFRTEWDVINTIKELIHNLELHEIKEFFRYKGRCVDEPHPPGSS